MSAVTKADDGSWTFQCPGDPGSPCGDPGSGRPFHSSGWPTKATATARGDQHLAEHESGEPMQELHDFRVDHKLIVSPVDGTVMLDTGTSLEGL